MHDDIYYTADIAFIGQFLGSELLKLFIFSWELVGIGESVTARPSRRLNSGKSEGHIASELQPDGVFK